MSKISDLAKTFQQTSQREAENIEQQIQSDLNVLTKSIREALQQSEQTISADIRAHQIAMSRAVFKPYLWSLMGLFTAAVVIVAGASIAIWSKRQELSEIRRETAAAEKVLAMMQDETSGLKIGTCETADGKSRPCVETDRQSAAYGNSKNTVWRLLPTPKTK